MDIEFESKLLKKLGFTIEPDNLTDPLVKDDQGWVISHSNLPGNQEKYCESRHEIAIWLYSRAVSVYPQYLAMMIFREILKRADEEVIEGLRAWGAGSRVSGKAETVVDEIRRLSFLKIIPSDKIWRMLAFDILMPHIQTKSQYLPLGIHMGLEFDAFLSSRSLTLECPQD